MNRLRIGLVGVGGYGRVHLRHLVDFHTRGELELVAVVVLPGDADDAVLRELVALRCEVFSSFASLAAALPQLRLDLCVVPTPIHLHAPMTVELLEAGVHVLVEKPIAATVAEVARIEAAARVCGRRVAVGFQYLHAPEVQALKHRLVRGDIGRLLRLHIHASWPRSHAYYTRNGWAGRLRVGDDWLLDSPVNNAMSHFLMLVLFLAGRDQSSVAEPVRLRAETYRAQAIESFDTAVLQLETAEGCRLDFYGTHSAADIARPTVIIEGTAGRAEWVQDGYATLAATGSSAAGAPREWLQAAEPESATREQMLRDVLAAADGERAFTCSPALAAAHVRCVAALAERVPITPIDARFLATERRGAEEFTYVPGLLEALRHAAAAGHTLVQTGLPWTVLPTTVRLPAVP